MKSILIDLHNHLLKKDGSFIDRKVINKYLKQRTKIECKKIIVFSDHFGNNLLENLDKYEKTFKELKCENEKQNCFLLLGTEIDIKFGEDAIRHLVIVWHKNFDSFYEFKNLIHDCSSLKLDKISGNQDLYNFLNDNNNCFFLPHYNKSDEKRNFTIKELDEFNKLFNNNKINCLEIQANLNTYRFFQNDDKVGNYHPLVATDRYVENNYINRNSKKDFKQNELLLASYIYVNDDQCNDSYKIVNDFLTQKESMSKISYDPEKDFTPPGIKYSFYLKNSMIFGNRGSGKTYLLEALKNAIDCNHDVNNKNEICSIEQFEFSNHRANSLDKFLKKDYITTQNNKIDQLISSLFNNEFLQNLRAEYEINSGDYLKDAKEYLKKFKENFNLTIFKNIEDNNFNLKNTNKKYSFFNKPFPNINIKHYEQINKIILNFKELIISLNEIKSDDHWKDLHTDIDTFIESLNRQSMQKLLEAFGNEYKWKQIKETNKEIFYKANQQVIKFSNWPYAFNKFNFENYFKLSKINETFDKFLKEKANTYIKNFENSRYSIKYSLTNGEYKDPKIVHADNPNIEASEGQINEFLLDNKIFEDCKNAKYFLFDEPEYAFDNKFIKDWSNNHIKKFKDNNNIVFVVTHNHIFWSEFYEQLNDKTYIKCSYDENNKDFLYEQFDDEEFQKKHSFKNYEVDKNSYDNRKGKYKI